MGNTYVVVESKKKLEVFRFDEKKTKFPSRKSLISKLQKRGRGRDAKKDRESESSYSIY